MDRAADVVDRDRRVQAAVGDPQIVQMAQRRPREVAQLRVMPLGLQLGDHDDRNDHVVLGEPAQRVRIAEQHRGVDDIGAASGAGLICRLGIGAGGRGRRHVEPFFARPNATTSGPTVTWMAGCGARPVAVRTSRPSDDGASIASRAARILATCTTDATSPEGPSGRCHAGFSRDRKAPATRERLRRGGSVGSHDASGRTGARAARTSAGPG